MTNYAAVNYRKLERIVVEGEITRMQREASSAAYLARMYYSTLQECTEDNNIYFYNREAKLAQARARILSLAARKVME